MTKATVSNNAGQGSAATMDNSKKATTPRKRATIKDTTNAKAPDKRSAKGRVPVGPGLSGLGLSVGTEGVVLKLKSMESLGKVYERERESVFASRGFSKDVLVECKKEISSEFEKGYMDPAREGIDMEKCKDTEVARGAGAYVRLCRFLIGKGYRVYLCNNDNDHALKYEEVKEVRVQCVDKDMLLNPCVRVNIPAGGKNGVVRKVVDAVMHQEYVFGFKVHKGGVK